jgi:malonyl-CoA/methylmalonyl-CoA synthetase
MSTKGNLYTSYREGFKNNLEGHFLYDDKGTNITYRELDSETAKLANGLKGLGLSEGDRVTVQVDKCVEMVYIYLACIRSNIIFHPLNPAYKETELSYFLDDAKPRLFISNEETVESVKYLNLEHNIDHLFTLNNDGTGDFFTIYSDESDFLTVDCSEDDIAALLYSSGTTGKPKGIMLSHGNISSNAKSLVKTWDFQESDCLLHALPIYHVHGLFVALGCVLMTGSKLKWLESFDVDAVLKSIPNCTVMMGVPTYYTRLLKSDALDSELTKQMRLFISGSAPLLQETFNEFKQRTKHLILERYGMTETNMNTSNPLKGDRKPGTVGLPLDDVQVVVVDEKNNALPQGEIGNLQVKGPNVFKGYWQMPEKTTEDFTEEGFFNTGDKGLIDEDGYVCIIGRSKDMIISGGLNVYPKEIEVLIDKVEGVLESAVVGLSDADLGERVVAIIVPKEGSEIDAIEVISLIKEKLAGFKVPKEVKFIDQLPRNAMGKVQKNILRETFT